MQQATPHGVIIYTIAKQSGQWLVSVLSGPWGLLAAYLVLPLGLDPVGAERPHSCVAARIVVSFSHVFSPPPFFMW